MRGCALQHVLVSACSAGFRTACGALRDLKADMSAQVSTRLFIDICLKSLCSCCSVVHVLWSCTAAQACSKCSGMCVCILSHHSLMLVRQVQPSSIVDCTLLQHGTCSATMVCRLASSAPFRRWFHMHGKAQ